MFTIATRARRALLSVLSLIPLAGGACGSPTEPYRSSPGTPVPEVTIQPASLILAVGQRVQLYAVVLASGGASAAVEWVSTDPEVAIVASDGTVEGIAAGEAIVIAIAGGARGVAEVGVRGAAGPGRPGRPPLK